MTYEEYLWKVDETTEEYARLGYHINYGGEELGFTWRGCELCKRPEGGDKYQLVAFNPVTGDQFDLAVCEDCLGLVANGHLDMFEGEINLK